MEGTARQLTSMRPYCQRIIKGQTPLIRKPHKIVHVYKTHTSTALVFLGLLVHTCICISNVKTNRHTSLLHGYKLQMSLNDINYVEVQ